MSTGPHPDQWPPLRTLADCALFHWNIRVRCRHINCGRTEVFDGAQLWYRFHRKHWSLALAKVKDHLRCEKCFNQARSRGLLEIELTNEAATMILPDPDRGEWKRLVQRTRC